MRTRSFRKLGNAVLVVPLAAPRLTLLALIAVTVATGLGLRYFSIDATADALLLEHDPDLEFYDETRAELSSDEYIIVAVSPTDPEATWLNVEHLRDLRRLVARFAALDGVAHKDGVPRVTSLLTLPLFRSPPRNLLVTMMRGDSPSTTLAAILDQWDEDPEAAEAALAAAREEILTHRIARDNLISADGRVTNILVYVTENDAANRLVFAETEAQQRLAAARRDGTPTAVAEAELAAVKRQRVAAYDDYASVRTNLVEDVRRLAAAEQAQGEYRLYLSGLPFLADEMVRMLQYDIRVFGLASLGFLALILLLFFARLRWVIVPIAISAMVVVWVVGTMSWFDIRLTIVTANIVSLLFVISMAHSIHLIVRFREVQEKHGHLGTERLRLLATLRRMWRPCAFTALTTGVGFASLAISDINPVMHFGYAMGVGTLVALGASFVAFPALVLTLGAPRPMPRKQRPAYERALRAVAGASRRGRVAIAVAVAAVLVASGVGIGRLHVETRIVDYFREGSDLRDGLVYIDRHMGGTSQLEVILDAQPPLVAPLAAWPDELELPAAFANRLHYDATAQELHWLAPTLDEPTREALALLCDDAAWRRALQALAAGHFAERDRLAVGATLAEWLATQTGIGKVMGAHDFLGVGIDTIEATMPTSSPALRERVIDLMWVREIRDNRELVRPEFISHDGSRLRIVARVQETAEGLTRNELLANLREHLASDAYAGYHGRPTGIFVLYSNMINSLMTSQYASFGIVFLAVFVMLVVLFRSPTLGLIGMLPNLVPIAVVLGVMGFVGIPLNIVTVSIAAIALGIGVDGTIHYVDRLREEFAVDGDVVAAVQRAHVTIGRAILITAVSVIGGLLIMLASMFTPTTYFGLFTAIAMAAALVGTLTILPAVILLLRPERALRRRMRRLAV